ncbi:ATP-dependent DNA helicase PIF1-like [Rhopilema esculentum]|uniref:ATP-dependent DNA helicase PIF1-like n=1 Tax=Rhopilema esculentum TaxID=499914 RepID=UPI0031D19C71
MYQVQPSDPQRYALRLLLLHCRGPTSFEDLRTIDGELLETFKDAAKALGILQDDAEHRNCLQEAAIINMPYQMRQLFATLIFFHTPADIRALFDEFKQSMSENYIRHDRHLHNDPTIAFQDRHMYLCLWDINTLLKVHGKSIEDPEFLELPQLPENFQNRNQDEENIDIVHETELGQQMFQLLNDDQRHIHDTVMEAIQTRSENNCFFVDGPAGTGKTFLYNTVVHNLQALGITVKCVAYSGIASTLLINGSTAHSTFQIPIPLLPDSTCNIKRQSVKAQQLLQTTVFIWDEASMIPVNALKVVNILLRDITRIDRPFGGKFMFLGGDFRQVLPVVLKAGRERIVQESMKNSPLWHHFRTFQLITNMRAIQDETYREFSDWLLRIGNGQEPQDQDNQITLSDHMLVQSLDEIVHLLYPPPPPGQPDIMAEPEAIAERCCLTPTNEASHDINQLILERLHGPTQTYLSTDRVITDDLEEAAAYPIEFLNIQIPTGMPLHQLELKVITFLSFS